MTSTFGLGYIVVESGIFTADDLSAILASPFVSLEQATTLVWFTEVIVIGWGRNRHFLLDEGNLSWREESVQRAFPCCISNSYTTLLFQTFEDVSHLIVAYSCCRP